MTNRILAAMFGSLVKEAGGLVAASYGIEAQTGHRPSVSTLSQIVNGHANVPIEWAWALEDVTGLTPFTDYRITNRATTPAERIDPLAATGSASKEHGEAIEWSLKAAGSTNGQHWARAATEHREAAEAHEKAAQACEAQSDVATFKRAG